MIWHWKSGRAVMTLVAIVLLSAGAVLLMVRDNVATTSSPQPVAANDTVPAEAEALFAYLQAGSYKEFAREEAKHRSKGPHPTPQGAAKAMVVAYFNSGLDKSLKDGNEAHPKGSAVVKEFYDDNDELMGWAVAVKTDDDSQSGQGWFWYEVLSTTDGSNPVAAANGVAACWGCHLSGSDFVLSAYPAK